MRNSVILILLLSLRSLFGQEQCDSREIDKIKKFNFIFFSDATLKIGTSRVHDEGIFDVIIHEDSSGCFQYSAKLDTSTIKLFDDGLIKFTDFKTIDVLNMFDELFHIFNSLNQSVYPFMFRNHYSFLNLNSENGRVTLLYSEITPRYSPYQFLEDPHKMYQYSCLQYFENKIKIVKNNMCDTLRNRFQMTIKQSLISEIIGR